MKGVILIMNLIPIKEVARRYDKTLCQVRYAIHQGRLSGIKIGWCWFCEENKLPKFWPTAEGDKK